MKNADKWQPTKIIRNSKNQWLPNPRVISPGSQFVAGHQVREYTATITTHASGSILDCGCGSVPYYEVYRDRVNQIECVDWSNSLHEVSFADKLADLNKKLPYEGELFDTVLLADVLEHIMRPDQLIGELSRLLAPGGKLLCFVPFMYWIHEDPHDYHRYTRFKLKQLCEVSGLDVLELRPYGGGPDVVIDLIAKLSSKNRFLQRLFSKLSTYYVKTKAYKKLRNRTKNKIPLGYVLVAQKPKTN